MITLIIGLTTLTASAQDPTPPMPIVPQYIDIVYRLFSTQNKWTFIKLNTRNGQMWQVQYSDEGKQQEVPLSLTKQVSRAREANERFFLYPTQNTNCFILLDQIDGRVWQVQWGLKETERMIIPIK